MSGGSLGEVPGAGGQDGEVPCGLGAEGVQAGGRSCSCGLKAGVAVCRAGGSSACGPRSVCSTSAGPGAVGASLASAPLGPQRTLAH